MEIEQSSLYREIEAIIKTTGKPVHHTWMADIHTPTETFRALKVISIDTREDYENNFSDEMLLLVSMPAGTYTKRIYPYQDNLDITLYKVPIREASDQNDQEAAIQAERYTATVIDRGNPIVEGNSGNNMSEDALNLTNVFEITFQLINKALEQLRMISVGGIYRNATNEEVVKALLTKESARVQVEGIRLPQGVDMIPAANQQRRDHVILPQGLSLVDVPAYVQTRCGGLYSAGLGYYLRGDYWYLYPCYDTTRFHQARRTLTIINVPPNKFPHVERTYRQDGNNLVILATGEVKLRDNSESMQLNLGNGVRFADANRFMSGEFVTTANNRTVASRGANNNEFVAEQRQTGNNLVRQSPRTINANPFVEFSTLAKRKGGIVGLEWQNANPNLLQPGMMLRMYYLDHDEILSLDGCLLQVHSFTQLRGQAVTETRYITNSVLYAFVNRSRD